MKDDNKISFSLDKVIDLLNNALSFILSLFKPLLSGIIKISGEGSIGFIIVFSIFFVIFLARTAARSEKSEIFGDVILNAGLIGFRFVSYYLFLLCLNSFIFPILISVLFLLFNSINGIEPSLGDFFYKAYNNEKSPHTGTNNSSLIFIPISVYFKDGNVLPISFQPTFIVLSMCLVMILVGKTLTRQRNTNS